MTKKEIMKWIQRLHVKSTHAKMVEGEMSFADYRNYIEYVINLIRGIAGFGEMKKSDFDLAWQNLSLGSESWNVAKADIFSAIAG